MRDRRLRNESAPGAICCMAWAVRAAVICARHAATHGPPAPAAASGHDAGDSGSSTRRIVGVENGDRRDRRRQSARPGPRVVPAGLRTPAPASSSSRPARPSVTAGPRQPAAAASFVAIRSLARPSPAKPTAFQPCRCVPPDSASDVWLTMKSAARGAMTPRSFDQGIQRVAERPGAADGAHRRRAAARQPRAVPGVQRLGLRSPPAHPCSLSCSWCRVSVGSHGGAR